MKRGEVSFTSLIIGLLVAGLIMSSLSLFIGGFSDDVYTSMNGSVNGTFASLDRTSEINSTVSSVSDIVTSNNESFIDQALGPIDEVFSVGFTSLRILLEIPQQYFLSTTAAINALGIPPTLSTIIVFTLTTIITAIGLLIIIRAVTKIT